MLRVKFNKDISWLLKMIVITSSSALGMEQRNPKPKIIMLAVFPIGPIAVGERGRESDTSGELCSVIGDGERGEGCGGAV